MIKTKFGNAKLGTNGYYQITSTKEDNNKKFLHRLVWEDWYGKPIPSNCVIHHLNNSIFPPYAAAWSIVLPSLRSKPESWRSGSEQLNVSLVLILVLVLAVSKIYIINVNFTSSHMKFDSIWHNSYIFISCNPFVKLIMPGLFVVFALFLSEMNLNAAAMTVFRF